MMPLSCWLIWSYFAPSHLYRIHPVIRVSAPKKVADFESRAQSVLEKGASSLDQSDRGQSYCVVLVVVAPYGPCTGPDKGFDAFDDSHAIESTDIQSFESSSYSNSAEISQFSIVYYDLQYEKRSQLGL